MPDSVGCKAFIPAILGTIAIVLGTASNMYCQSVTFPQEDDGGGGALDVSPFYYRTKDIVELFGEPVVVVTCRNYNYLNRELGFDYDWDSTTKTVRAFAIMTPLIGALGLIVAYLAPCFHSLTPAQWKIMVPIFFIACLFQGITLLIVNSSICSNNPVMQYLIANNYDTVVESLPEECEKGLGYTLNIIAVVFWCLAGVSPLIIPPPKFDGRAVEQRQTVTYQQNNADGTVEESNVNIVKGTNVASAAEAVPETAKQ